VPAPKCRKVAGSSDPTRDQRIRGGVCSDVPWATLGFYRPDSELLPTDRLAQDHENQTESPMGRDPDQEADEL
jgi:hypothetical protein